MKPITFIFLHVACLLHTALGGSHQTSVTGHESNSSTVESPPGVLCCHILRGALHEKVVFPNNSAYTNYQSGPAGYWSQQAATPTPACRFLAESTEDVQFAVSLLTRHQCLFAVRSGGHMSWAGAANIERGVTLDLSALNQVIVSTSANQTITSIGPGARWKDVYLKLDALNLTVTGGRVAEVGVGGLTLGGGNSFFAAEHGFACDNVVNYKVVLGSGNIVDANITHHPGLYKALKGGSNNFGIVTRFDFQTYQQGKLWGGMIFNSINSSSLQFQYLQDFATASGSGVDNHASVINAYIFTPLGPTIIANQVTYTKPQPYPCILNNITNNSSLPQILPNTLRITNLTDLTIELGAGTPNGYRQLFGTATFVNNATLFQQIYNLAIAAFTPLYAIPGFQASFVLQPISKAILHHVYSNGGNVLGLTANQNLVWLDLTLQWNLSTSDAAMTNATTILLAEAIKYAKSQGLYNRFLYLNYAMKHQDPMAGYGAENVAYLRNISCEYDPDQVFQTLVPGGFKLSREGFTCC